MSAAATFAAVFAALFAGHHAGDYWVQRKWMAAEKGLPGWDGRYACAMHAVTYTATLGFFLAAAWWWLGLHITQPWYGAGMLVAGVTHYWADRRAPLRKLARLLGSGDFWKMGEGLATGAALLDQAWHIGWLFVSALIITGPPR